MKFTRRHALPVIATTGLLASGLFYNFPFEDEVIGVSEAKAEDLSTLGDPGPLGEHILGDPNAPVTIIEYASLTCPHCKTFHETVLPVIKEKYIDTGKAKLYFREFPFDPAAVAAFMLANCAGEEKYFPMVDVFFKQQSVWKGDNIVDELFKISKLAGFTQESFNTCLKDQQLLDNVVSIQKKAQKVYEVNATPTLFINGTKYDGGMSAEELGKYIEDQS